MHRRYGVFVYMHRRYGVFVYMHRRYGVFVYMHRRYGVFVYMHRRYGVFVCTCMSVSSQMCEHTIYQEIFIVSHHDENLTYNCFINCTGKPATKLFNAKI